MKLQEHIDILSKLRFRYKKALASLIIDVMKQHYNKKLNLIEDTNTSMTTDTFLALIIKQDPKDPPLDYYEPITGDNTFV